MLFKRMRRVLMRIKLRTNHFCKRNERESNLCNQISHFRSISRELILHKNVDLRSKMSRPQKQTPAKQGNTLFSYFTKTPNKDATPQKPKDVLSPRRSPNNKGKSPASKTKGAVASPSSSPNTGNGGLSCSLCQ